MPRRLLTQVSQPSDRKLMSRPLPWSAILSVSPASGTLAVCPSGQREQTVNLPAQPTMVRTHQPPHADRTASHLWKHGEGPILLLTL